jgi:hypothetical protein
VKWPFIRSILLFFAGLVGVFYEMLFVHPADPSLIVLFAGMMGLPLFLQRDEK